jgi:hypothetical protein
MTIPRPLVRDKTSAIIIGVALFVAGSWFLYDAWERRGQRTPRIARPFTWW